MTYNRVHESGGKGITKIIHKITFGEEKNGENI